MIKIVDAGPAWAPVAFCDVCGKRIHEDGWYYWGIEEDERSFRLAHQKCNLRLARERDLAHNDDHLSKGLIYLLRNVGLSWEDIEQRIEWARMVGGNM